jgi:hypothetical protein
LPDSGFVGVSCLKNNKWQAYTPKGFHNKGKGRQKNIGYYDTALEAARARRDYMLEHSAHAINSEETDESDGDEGEDDEHVQDVKSQAADACPDEDEELQKGYVYQAGDEYLERSKMPSSLSGYRGVTRQGGKWVARKGNQKRKTGKESSRYLAFLYDSAIDAARARRDFMANPSTAPAQSVPEEADESDEDGDDDDDEASVPPLPGDDKLEQSNRSINNSGNSPPNIHILAV